MIGNRKRWIWMLCVVLAVGGLSSFAMAVVTQDEAPAAKQETKAAEPVDTAALTKKAQEALGSPSVVADTLWVLLAGFLVFFMNLGFGCVETGFCRAKNAVNILSKNFIVFSAATFGFWVLGWGLMFGDGGWFSGTSGLWFLGGEDYSPLTGDALPEVADGTSAGVYDAINWSGAPLKAKFFFQLVFCCTAATIVSGCVAERIKYGSFIIFSVILSVLIYPVVGHWIWGGGLLGSLETPFLDFAGSTQVHSIGGWAGLAGIIILGPRIGKYTAEGKVAPIPGHSMSLATIGCFILWLGWFGFNPGSTMGAAPGDIAHIAVTTNTAAVLATLSATVTCWLLMGKPDLGMTLNGALAGLVAITAPCAFVTVGVSAIIGVIAGVLVVFSVLFFDKMKIDDPVGALSVHLSNGIFGTLAVGLFADEELIGAAGGKAGLFMGGGGAQLMSQIIGVLAAGAYVFILALIVWVIIKAVMGVRVSAEEEIQGLDIGEHGQEAYAGFTIQQK